MKRCLIFNKLNLFRTFRPNIRGLQWINIILLTSFIFTSLLKAPSEKIIYSRFKKNKIQIDGILSDWDNSDPVFLNGEKAGSENWVEIRSQWDDNSLYLSFDVKDKNLQAYQTAQDDSQLFLDDIVEVLFDVNNDKNCCWGPDDIVYHINLLGVKKDDRGTAECLSDPLWDGDANYSVKLSGSLNDTTDIDFGYVVEIGIPWVELGLTIDVGLKIGINFANGDNDGKGRRLFDWVGAWPVRSPYAFGTLILVEEK